MKKVFSLLTLISVGILLSGCTNDAQRLEYIRAKLGTNEIWFSEAAQSNVYVVRRTDGSIWVVERSGEGSVENLAMRQIFSPR